MRTLRVWLVRFGGLFRRRQFEQELDEEIESNLQLHVDDLIESGLSPTEARRLALVRFGGVEATKEAFRDRRGIPLLEAVARDMVYAARMLGRNKGWTAVAVISLALGIGANTALFSLVDSLLLEQLPVRQPDQLVAFRWTGDNDKAKNQRAYGYIAHGAGWGNPSFSFRAFEVLKEANQTLSELFAFAPGPQLNLIAKGQPETATAEFVSGEYYRALGLPPVRGRTLLPEDDTPGADLAIVISRAYWERRFGEDPSIVGTAVQINGVPAVLVGVVPSEAGEMLRIGSRSPDVFMSLALEPRLTGGNSRNRQESDWWLLIMGRLMSGSSLNQVQDNLGPAFRQVAREGRILDAGSPQQEPENASRHERSCDLRLVPGARGIYDSGGTHLLVLQGTILGTLFIIVCVNLTTLLLARMERRREEIATRLAIGATRARIFRQLLTESAVLTVVGAAASVSVAWVCQRLLGAFLEYNPATLASWAVLSFVVVASAISLLCFGILPSWRASGLGLGEVTQASGSKATHTRSRLGKALVVVQVGLSLALLVAAGLFLRTLTHLQSIEVGFNADHLLLFTLDPGFGGYDDSRAAQVFDQLTERLAALPGVQSAAFSSKAILSRSTSSRSLYIEGKQPTEPHPADCIYLNVHPNFFTAMSIPLRLGRNFTPQDDRTAPAVAIVNQAFVRAYVPKSNPIGRRFSSGKDDPAKIEIVGVVGDTLYRSLREPPSPIYFLPAGQGPGGPRTFEVRTAGDPNAMIPTVREVVRQLDPSLPLLNVTTQRETIAANWRLEGMLASVTSLFGGLALVVSAIGLFGLMSYLVTCRTREIGIRMTLGADRGDVLRSVMREALMLFAVGALVGLGTALATTRLLKNFLFGLAPSDPITIAAAVFIMLSVATLAGYAPARRASRVDPQVALRHE